MTPAHEFSSDLIVKAANIVRGLSIDAVQAANSGHPGLPLGAADFATVLWTHFLRHNPKNPQWQNRDRFVLSGGHGSMLLYALLHLTGYDVSLADLQAFRQWGSRTPGHPEYGHTPGVETTTGPLGQGLANAVGMAMAEAMLAARFNEADFPVVDHYTYVVATDGDLQEGVTHEACALAGHQQLGKLVVLYDDNHITIDGATDLSFSEKVLQRFVAYGWHTQQVDGHDPQAVYEAIVAARENTSQPSIISCKTIIGKGSPHKAGTAGVHGAPLGEEELRLTKEALGLPPDEAFYVPANIAEFFGEAVTRGAHWQAEWDALFSAYEQAHPEKATTYLNLDKVPAQALDLQTFTAGEQVATRSASGAILNQLAPALPALVGGSADLTPSNNTLPQGATAFMPDNRQGRYIHYGIREHGMAAIMNGLALHGGVIPYGGTFFVFTDYMRPAMRMAALMGLRVIYVLTHDSIGLGEDGPTHQPVEHLSSLRAMPNMLVFRPADANEAIVGWQQALQRSEGPTCLVLTRQKLPVLNREVLAPYQEAAKGGYVLVEDDDYEVILIATGSEVSLALAARDMLNDRGYRVRVVSMPSTELFDAQPQDYRHSVLPPDKTARVAVEAGATWGWQKYVGLKGQIIGLDRFGASAPYQTLYEELGITAEAVARAAEALLA